MGARGIAHVAVHEQQAADARSPHRLQIGGDAFARDVAFEPEAIDPRPGRVGRRPELGGQVSAVNRVCAGPNHRTNQNRQMKFGHSLDPILSNPS